MKPIERISIVEQVINNLKDYITENNLAVGDKMPTEKEICEMYGVGRSTAREAYRMMQAIGMLEVQRGKGAYYKGIPDEQADDERVAVWFRAHGKKISDYVETRIAIETMACKLALGRISEKQLEHLRVIHELFTESVRGKNYMKMAFYDEEFHHKITEASENELLIRLEKIISEGLVDFRVQTYSIDQNAEHAIASHQAVLDAFLARDSVSCVQQMTEHLENSLVDMQALLDENYEVAVK